MNETAYWDQIPECRLAGVMLQIVGRILGLRDKFGRGRRLLIRTMDVRSSFRQVGVDAAGAVNFGYVLGNYLFVHTRLQFGRGGGPGGGGYWPVFYNKRSDRRPGNQRRSWGQEWRL